jgi:hypothetical protein
VPSKMVIFPAKAAELQPNGLAFGSTVAVGGWVVAGADVSVEAAVGATVGVSAVTVDVSVLGTRVRGTNVWVGVAVAEQADNAIREMIMNTLKGQLCKRISSISFRFFLA